MEVKKLSDRFDNTEKKNLLFCFVTTFIFGLIAHAYGFLNNIFSHDSLNALYADRTENLAKLAVGRFLVPIVRAVRGPVAIPWIIGIVALCLIALSTYLVLKMFNIRSGPAAVVISGIMVTNITVTALTATYVHELDVDMFALLFSCYAAYLWQKNKKITDLIPVVLLSAASMAIYQSYAEVTVTLMIMTLIIRTLENEKLKNIFVDGVKGAASVGLAAVIYFALNKAVISLFKTDMLDRVDLTSEYNESLFTRAYMMFKNIAIALFTPPTVISTIIVALISVIALTVILWSVIKAFRKNKVTPGGIAFTFLLLAMLPVGMDFICLLSHNNVHDVMIYSFWFIYIFAVILAVKYCSADNGKKNIVRAVALVITAVMVWNNILVSNTAYIKKDMEQDVTLSMMNNIIQDLEERDDYVIGETEVAFSGYPAIHKLYPGFERVSKLIGLAFTSSTGAMEYTPFFNGYKNFFAYFMNYPIVVSYTDYHLDSRVVEMPSYPEEGYIENIDGVLVVKLGEKKLPIPQKTNLERDIIKLKELFS